MDADIRERTVVERGEFVIGAPAPTPLGRRVPRRNEEIDQRHSWTPQLMVHRTIRIDPALANPKPRIAAMRKVNVAAAFMPSNAALQ